MKKPLRRLVYSTFGSYDHVDADGGEISFSSAVAENICPCCSTLFSTFQAAKSKSTELCLLLCPTCGWWHLHQNCRLTTLDGRQSTSRWWELHHAILTEIDLQSPEIPIEQLRLHLQRHWRDRIHITAQQAEEVIAAVLKDFYGGEILRLTANANTPDGGIDLIVVSNGGLVKRAIQIKRRITRDVEPISDVRNFVGAMILTGNKTGAFVTTASRFSKDASQLPKNANLTKHRLSLDLIDGERLLELLEHTNATTGSKLPEPITSDLQWTNNRGDSFTISELLFHDLSRIQAPITREGRP